MEEHVCSSWSVGKEAAKKTEVRTQADHNTSGQHTVADWRVPHDWSRNQEKRARRTEERLDGLGLKMGRPHHVSGTRQGHLVGLARRPSVLLTTPPICDCFLPHSISLDPALRYQARRNLQRFRVLRAFLPGALVGV